MNKISISVKNVKQLSLLKNIQKSMLRFLLSKWHELSFSKRKHSILCRHFGICKTKRVINFRTCMHKTPESSQGKAASFYQSLPAHSQTFFLKRFFRYGEKLLKCTIIIFYVFICKPVLQTCSEQVVECWILNRSK